MIHSIAHQPSSQDFVQLYSSVPRDLSFLRSFIPSFELLDWDPSLGTVSSFLQLDADLVVTKRAQSVSRYAYRFLEPGIMLFDAEKKLGCELPKDVSSLKEFLSEEKRAEMKKLIANVERSLDTKTMAEISSIAAQANLGCRVTIDSKIDLYFGMPIAEFMHFRKAIDYLQKSFTSAEGFWNETNEKSLDILCNAYCELSGGISYTRSKDWISIPQEEVNGKRICNLQKLAKDNGLSKEDKATLIKLELLGRIYDRDLYTEEEERVMNLVAFLPVKVSEIMPSMRNFIEKLKKQYEIMQKLGKVNYIKLAAFAHQSITKIHPFENHNNRFSRALITALLMQGGYDPVLFYNNEEYIEEAIKVRKDLKSFERYLERYVQITESLQGELAALN